MTIMYAREVGLSKSQYEYGQQPSVQRRTNLFDVNIWAVADTLPEYIAVTDTEGIIVYLNAAWYQLIRERAVGSMGFTIGNHFAESFAVSFGSSNEDIQAMRQGLSAVLSGTEEYFSMEYPYQRPHHQHWFTTTITSAYIANGTRGAVIRQVDTTAHKNNLAIVERQSSLLKLLSRITEHCSQHPPVTQRFAAIVDDVGHTLELSRVALVPYEPANDVLAPTTWDAWHHPHVSWLDTGIQRSLDHDAAFLHDFPQWHKTLRQEQPVYGTRAAFSPQEQTLLHKWQIHSLALIPIFVYDQLWGVLQCDDSRYARAWVAEEIDALKTIAMLLGGMLERSRAE
jgi:hypothetical protein